MAGDDLDPCSYDSAQTVFRTLWVIGNLFGLSAFALILSWILLYNKGFTWDTFDGAFNYHVILMVIFVIYLQGNASLVHRLLPATPKYYSKLIHAGLHFLVCIGMTFSLVSIIRSLDLLKGLHFASLHSWIGIATIGCYYLQFIFGFFAMLYPGASPDSHRSLFVSAVAAAVSGIMQIATWSLGDDFFSLRQSILFLNFTGFFALLFVLTIIYLLGDHIFRRRPPPLQYTVPGSIGQSIYYGATSSAHFPTTSREKVVY